MATKKIVLQGEEVKPTYEKQKVSVKGAVANSDGYYKGAIIKTGQKFDFDGFAEEDGELPHWIDRPEGYKPKKAIATVRMNDVVEGQVLDEDSVDQVIPADNASMGTKISAKVHNAKASVKNAVDHLV